MCFSCKICVRGYDFWKSYVFMVVLLSFVMFVRVLCLKDRLDCTCLGGKIIASLLV